MEKQAEEGQKQLVVRYKKRQIHLGTYLAHVADEVRDKANAKLATETRSFDVVKKEIKEWAKEFGRQLETETAAPIALANGVSNGAMVPVPRRLSDSNNAGDEPVPGGVATSTASSTAFQPVHHPTAAASTMMNQMPMAPGAVPFTVGAPYFHPSMMMQQPTAVQQAATTFMAAPSLAAVGAQPPGTAYVMMQNPSTGQSYLALTAMGPSTQAPAAAAPSPFAHLPTSQILPTATAPFGAALPPSHSSGTHVQGFVSPDMMQQPSTASTLPQATQPSGSPPTDISQVHGEAPQVDTQQPVPTTTQLSPRMATANQATAASLAAPAPPPYGVTPVATQHQAATMKPSPATTTDNQSASVIAPTSFPNGTTRVDGEVSPETATLPTASTVHEATSQPSVAAPVSFPDNTTRAGEEFAPETTTLPVTTKAHQETAPFVATPAAFAATPVEDNASTPMALADRLKVVPVLPALERGGPGQPILWTCLVFDNHDDVLPALDTLPYVDKRMKEQILNDLIDSEDAQQPVAFLLGDPVPTASRLVVISGDTVPLDFLSVSPSAWRAVISSVRATPHYQGFQQARNLARTIREAASEPGRAAPVAARASGTEASSVSIQRPWTESADGKETEASLARQLSRLTNQNGTGSLDRHVASTVGSDETKVQVSYSHTGKSQSDSRQTSDPIRQLENVNHLSDRKCAPSESGLLEKAAEQQSTSSDSTHAAAFGLLPGAALAGAAAVTQAAGLEEDNRRHNPTMAAPVADPQGLQMPDTKPAASTGTTSGHTSASSQPTPSRSASAHSDGKVKAKASAEQLSSSTTFLDRQDVSTLTGGESVADSNGAGAATKPSRGSSHGYRQPENADHFGNPKRAPNEAEQSSTVGDSVPTATARFAPHPGKALATAAKAAALEDDKALRLTHGKEFEAFEQNLAALNPTAALPGLDPLGKKPTASTGADSGQAPASHRPSPLQAAGLKNAQELAPRCEAELGQAQEQPSQPPHKKMKTEFVVESNPPPDFAQSMSPSLLNMAISQIGAQNPLLTAMLNGTNGSNYEQNGEAHGSDDKQIEEADRRNDEFATRTGFYAYYRGLSEEKCVDRGVRVRAH